MAKPTASAVTYACLCCSSALFRPGRSSPISRIRLSPAPSRPAAFSAAAAGANLPRSPTSPSPSPSWPASRSRRRHRRRCPAADLIGPAAAAGHFHSRIPSLSSSLSFAGGDSSYAYSSSPPSSSCGKTHGAPSSSGKTPPSPSAEAKSSNADDGSSKKRRGGGGGSSGRRTAVVRYDNNVATIPFVGPRDEAVALRDRMTAQTHKHHVFLVDTDGEGGGVVPVGPYATLEEARNVLASR